METVSWVQLCLSIHDGSVMSATPLSVKLDLIKHSDNL